jgi:hypothetical protein
MYCILQLVLVLYYYLLRQSVSKVIEEMKFAEHDDWKLVRAFDKADDIEKQRKQLAGSQKKPQKSQRTPFIPSHKKVSPNAGYVIWNDSEVVIFFSNDLASTP